MSFRACTGLLIGVGLYLWFFSWHDVPYREALVLNGPGKLSGGAPASMDLPGVTETVSTGGGVASAGPPDVGKLQNIDERFTFDVRYGFLRLGNVEVYMRRDTVYRDTEVVHLVAEMVSNRRIPLVGYREVHYHSYIAFNDSIPYGVKYWQDSIHREKKKQFLYDFDYPSGKVYSFEEGNPVDTLELTQPADGGPAVMFYSRLFAGTDSDKRYPLFIDHEQKEIEMNFTSQQEAYDSPAFPDEEIQAFKMSGNADFEGPFGFSGNFTAYFKDDELRIPLEARVNIWLGSVRVRLIEYEVNK